jgi:quinol monooxygenase YgiN
MYFSTSSYLEAISLNSNSYKDAAAFEAHRNSDHFKAALARQSEGLFEGPPKIQVIQRKAGFRRG